MNRKHGVFKGEAETRWLADGRDMKLLSDLMFVETDSLKFWMAKKGEVVDGASIPRFCWRIIGCPFVGKYRRASIVHDVYCKNKSRPWQDVHRMFYRAMLADGVSRKKAWVMFQAVWYGGPRWEM